MCWVLTKSPEYMSSDQIISHKALLLWIRLAVSRDKFKSKYKSLLWDFAQVVLGVKYNAYSSACSCISGNIF